MWKTESKSGMQVEPAIKQVLPPCQVRCPINEDIQRTNVLLSMLSHDPVEAKKGIIQIGDYLFERNPLFTACGYVCGLCEQECNYSSRGGSIRRRLLKRFLSDTYTDYLPEKEELKIVKNKEDVAVIGGGPGGLFAAFDLSKRGYRVTLFEASDRLGGALWLIPQYRLPEKVLANAVNNLVRTARVEVKYNARIDQGKLTLDRLRNDGFKAVFIARGTPAPRLLTFGRDKVEGQDLEGVMYGQTFLYEVSHGNTTPESFRGKRVIVIGGGNVAFDVARTVRRFGAEVTLACLECEDKTCKDGIPADHEEVKGAWQEGINIVYSRGVSRIAGKNGKFAFIESPLCTSVFDQNGMFNPKFETKDCIPMEGDFLVIAIGQGVDRETLEKEGLLDEKGRMGVDQLTLQSLRQPWVFVGGDMKKIGFMAEAMRDGLIAAESIERYLRGRDLREGRSRQMEPLGPPKRRTYKHEPEIVWIPPEKRMHFQLFEKGFTLDEAIEEAKRCLACGPCTSCKACLSVGLQEVLPTVEVHEDLCSGCGVCVSVCYYDAAASRLVDEKKVSTTDSYKCKGCGMCVVACPAKARELIGDAVEPKVERVLGALRAP